MYGESTPEELPMLSAHPVTTLPLPTLSDEDCGDWLDTDFGAVKLQEIGGTSVVYRDEFGMWTFAHILDDGFICDAPAGICRSSKNLTALEADTDFLAAVLRTSRDAGNRLMSAVA